MIFSTTRSIEENDIEAPRTRGTVAHSGVDSTGGASELFQELPTLRDLEKAYIEHVLQVSGHAKEKTARVLGMDRKTLYRKILEFGIRERESG